VRCSGLGLPLGTLSLSAGPFSTPSEKTVPSACVYDQMFPLERVQKYIPLFGGGEKEVLEMRILAVGGSIMHPISTAAAVEMSTPSARFHRPQDSAR